MQQLVKMIFVLLSICSELALSSLPSGSNRTTRIIDSFDSKNAPPDDKKHVCRIVAHDKVRGFLNWPLDWFKHAAFNKCNQKVVFTEDSKEINKANIIIFHAPTHGIGMPKPRPKDAIYAMVSMEQPKYAKYLADLKYLTTHFDLMVTYSLAPIYPGTTVPNLPITYYPSNIVSPQAVLQPARPFSEKTGYGTGVSVVLFASNCDRAGAKERYQYIEELMKTVQVHSYGKCFNNRKEPEMQDDPAWPPIAQRRARKIKILSQYKFYLAFENAPVEDYVSEKVFEGLIAGSLPVYRGASSIHRFMPDNTSFIDANVLSARELGQRLNDLADCGAVVLPLNTLNCHSTAGNEGEYSKYFEFKSRPLSTGFQDMALMSYVHPNVLCRLCDYYASTEKGRKVFG